LPPNPGQGDLRLTRDGGGRMVLRKDGVEIGNSRLIVLYTLTNVCAGTENGAMDCEVTREWQSCRSILDRKLPEPGFKCPK
jgi:hypothetical protein